MISCLKKVSHFEEKDGRLGKSSSDHRPGRLKHLCLRCSCHGCNRRWTFDNFSFCLSVNIWEIIFCSTRWCWHQCLTKRIAVALGQHECPGEEKKAKSTETFIFTFSRWAKVECQQSTIGLDSDSRTPKAWNGFSLPLGSTVHRWMISRRVLKYPQV